MASLRGGQEISNDSNGLGQLLFRVLAGSRPSIGIPVETKVKRREEGNIYHGLQGIKFVFR